MTVQATNAMFEALLSFDQPMPVIDIETQEATLTTQDLRYFTVFLNGDSQIAEAETLFSLLSELSSTERAHLNKVSLCLVGTTESDARQIAPWLWAPDSPLYDGKLWLQQHKANGVVAV